MVTRSERRRAASPAKYAACAMALAMAACSSDPKAAGTRSGVGPVRPDTSTTAPPAGQGLPTAPTGSNDVHVIETSKPTLEGTAGTGLKEGQCAGRQVATARVVPKIWLVIDGSGSMLNPLSAMSEQTRWAALYDALMNADGGIVKSLEKEVEWGVVLYDGPSPGGNPNVMLPDGGVRMLPPADTCPRVITVEPKKEAFTDISAVVGVDPLGGSTPTDKALNVVVNHLDDMSGQVLDMRVNPTIVVLATDGEPNDFCGGGMQQGGFLGFPMPVDVRPQVIAAVEQLASMSIKTYVISLAGEDMNLTAHLNEVAAAGGTGLAPFFPTTKDTLVQAFKDIIGPPTACDVVLNGSVKAGLECMGSIKINGTALPCGDPNGWALKDPSTVVIQGTACESYKNDLNAFLEADFPCELIDLN